MGNQEALFLKGIEVLDVLGVLVHYAIFYRMIGRLQKPKLIDLGIGRKGVDQPDIGSFGGLDGTDPPVMGWMHVPDLKASPFPIKAARPEGGKTTLVGHFGERIDLVLKLTELTSGKEIPNHRG